MRKKIKKIRHQLSRSKYELKKRRISFKRKRECRVRLRKYRLEVRKQIALKDQIVKVSPSNFSLIDNTEEVVKYINDCRELLHKKEKKYIDLEAVEKLTPDAIAVLVACANDKKFRGEYGQISGNAPQRPNLSKLLFESGFYQYVQSSPEMKFAQNRKCNLLHKESDFIVQPNWAKQACLYGTNHVFGNSSPNSDLYEMIIEAMSNTNNHASSNKGNVKWWLYAYNNPNGNTCYSFVDLGVGIFESLPVQTFKKTKIKLGFSHNIDLVKDLLDGKIKSREKMDNKIRGKGIPQIANNSQNNIFARAIIISNNVKINLKTKQSQKITSSFRGTFLYWELTNPKTYESIKN